MPQKRQKIVPIPFSSEAEEQYEHMRSARAEASTYLIEVTGPTPDKTFYMSEPDLQPGQKGIERRV